MMKKKNLPVKKEETLPEEQASTPFSGSRIRTVEDLIKFLSQYKGITMIEGGRLLRNQNGFYNPSVGASEFEMRVSFKILLDPQIKDAWEKRQLPIPPDFKPRDYHHVDLQIELNEDPYEKERVIVVKETQESLLICSAASEQEIVDYVYSNWHEPWKLAGKGIRMVCDEDPSFSHYLFYLPEGYID